MISQQKKIAQSLDLTEVELSLIYPGSYRLSQKYSVTALLSNGEHGSLLAGTGYVAELTPESGKPVVVLAHYELEKMARNEQKE